MNNALPLGPAPGVATADYLTLNGGTVQITGSGSLAFNANRGVTLGAAGGTVDIVTGRLIDNQSIVAGVGGLSKIGGGEWQLFNANTFAGGTTVSNGTLNVTGSLNDAGFVTVSGGTYNVGASDTVGAVTLSTGSISGAGTLTGSSYSLTNNGTISAILSGTGALTKTGAGTTVLSSPSTYSGATTVSAGKLDVTGSLASPTFTVSSNATLTTASTLNAATGTSTVDGTLDGTGALNVKTGATLQGAGTVGVATTIEGGATHSPGNSPGIQTFDAGLAYSSNSTFVWELIDNTTSGRGTNFDGVNVTGGSLSIDPAATANLVFNANSTVDWSNSFWSSDKSWLVFDNVDGGNTTVFGTIFASTTVTVDGLGATGPAAGEFSWSLIGNDVYLNFLTAVPEPASFGGAFVLLGTWYARRRRSPRLNPEQNGLV